MSGRDRYGCTSNDDACVVRTFADRAVDASRALARNAASIDLTRKGTPGEKRSPWRIGRSAGDYDR